MRFDSAARKKALDRFVSASCKLSRPTPSAERTLILHLEIVYLGGAQGET